MNNYFITIAEMCVSKETPPLVIVRKIMKYHIIPMHKVYLDLKIRIVCLNHKGLKSGYRPYRWEKSRLKKGDSEHTFGQGPKGSINLNKKGAADWRCEDFQLNKQKLISSIIKNTNYTRLIIYNHHIHTDYKFKKGALYVFKSNDGKNITLINKILK